MLVPLIAPAFMLFEFAAPPMTVGLAPRWRELLGNGAAVRATLAVRTGSALCFASRRINALFEAVVRAFEPG